MNNKTLNILALIVCILYLIGLSIAIYKIIIWNKEHKNCHYETYTQYPCEGATHYARVHRNQNKGCERTKIICKGD